MTTLRFLVILLLLLNALAFAAIKGWLGTTPVRGEPERITNQLHPDRIRLQHEVDGRQALVAAPTPPAPAEPMPAVEPPPPATPAPTLAPTPLQCQTWDKLSSAEADQLAARLRNAGLNAQRDSVEVPTSWWVRIPPDGGREGAERRARELRSQGVTDLFIVQETGPNQYAVSLGLFKNPSSANVQLTQLRSKGVRGASIVVRNTTEYRMTVRAEADTLKDVLSGDPWSQRRVSCQP